MSAGPVCAAPGCEVSLADRRAGTRTCSDACRVAAHRARQQAANRYTPPVATSDTPAPAVTVGSRKRRRKGARPGDPLYERAIWLTGRRSSARVRLFCEGCGEVAFAWTTSPDDPVTSRFANLHQRGGHQVTREDLDVPPIPPRHPTADQLLWARTGTPCPECGDPLPAWKNQKAWIAHRLKHNPTGAATQGPAGWPDLDAITRKVVADEQARDPIPDYTPRYPQWRQWLPENRREAEP